MFFAPRQYFCCLPCGVAHSPVATYDDASLPGLVVRHIACPYTCGGIEIEHKGSVDMASE
jgi:hypothetical protein